MRRVSTFEAAMLKSNGANAQDTIALMAEIGRTARAAARPLAMASAAAKTAALNAMADAILRNKAVIIEANAIDLKNGEEAGLSSALMDRLKLTPERIAGMAEGVRTV